MHKITSLFYLEKNWKAIVKEAASTVRLSSALTNFHNTQGSKELTLKLVTRKTTNAGKATWNHHKKELAIEINKPLFDKKENCNELHSTVMHELAHIFTFIVDHSMDHGPKWRQLMVKLGEVPERCHSMNTTALGKKRTRYVVTCEEGCEFRLTKYKLENNLGRYCCTKHRNRLSFIGKIVEI